MAKHTLTRKELYDLIWTRPMWKIAPEFGMSGNGLAKLCRREDLPVPERGHWAKLQHGKSVVQPKLKGDYAKPVDIMATDSNRAQLESKMPEHLAKALAAERAQHEPIPFPKSPKPHPIVEAWGKRRTSYGVKDRLSATEARRSRLASVLFRELEKRGFAISAETAEKFEFALLGYRIKVALTERLEMVTIPSDPKRMYSYERKEWRGTGLLKLRFENYFDIPVRREWKETIDRPIEQRLREIIAALYVAVEAERERSEKAAEQARRWHEAEMRRLEAEERRRDREREIAELKAEARAWEEASRIRAYVAAVVAVDSSRGDWAERALEIANGLDPMAPI